MSCFLNNERNRNFVYFFQKQTIIFKCWLASLDGLTIKSSINSRVHSERLTSADFGRQLRQFLP